MEKRFSGIVVPMVTPFTSAHRIDEGATRRITDLLIEYGAHPFVLGTTGESASIPNTERVTMVRATVEAAAGKATVYAGVSGNCMKSVLEEARQFADLGANALVSTMPSYYPVDSDQMLRYFSDLADTVPLPLIIYNIPSTTHLSIPLEIADKLSKHENIVGYKDSERGEARIEEAIALWKTREDFSYLLGWAAMSYKAMLLGADGIVPSTGNFSPGLYQIIYDAGRSGNADLALAAQQKADRVSSIYQKDKILSRSLPLLKVIMSAWGLSGTDVLPPLYQVSDSEEEKIRNEVVAEYGSLQNINTINGNEH